MRPERGRYLGVAVIAAMLPSLGAALAATEPDDGYLGDGIVAPAREYATEELARAVQNPVADLISLPFQNNTNLQLAPRDGTQNMQPVVPRSLSDDRLMITRTILPLVSQPSFRPGQDRNAGLGDTLFSAFFSPRGSRLPLRGGAGPALLLPTATSDRRLSNLRSGNSAESGSREWRRISRRWGERQAA